MKHMIIRSIHIILCMTGLILSSCKEEFLEIKPDRAQVVPSSLKDLQALLDNTGVMNVGMPVLQELGSDNYFSTPEAFQSIRGATERNAYIWAKNLYEGEDGIDWNVMYRQVFYANMVIEGLEKSSGRERSSKQWEEIKGGALFYRAWAYNQLAQMFCKTYDPQTAANDPGIPLRTESDINLASKRATVKETYDQIISDLETSIALLPNEVPLKTRPSKAAAEALLSRTYLHMAEYGKAKEHALKAIQLYSAIIDFNSLNPSASYPIPRFNEEVIFHASMANSGNFSSSRLNVDSTL
ncbi:MAG TPA: RagB/SusD family nutrient uptake outer membrane protein, partial [Sphingobacteriaceae bacterium]